MFKVHLHTAGFNIKKIAEPLRKSIQDLLQQQREAAEDVQAVLDEGDAATLKHKLTRLAMVMQQVQVVQEALDVVEKRG